MEDVKRTIFEKRREEKRREEKRREEKRREEKRRALSTSLGTFYLDAQKYIELYKRRIMPE